MTRDKKMTKKNCFNDHEMLLKTLNKKVEFRGETIEYSIEVYVCDACNLEVADLKQSSEIQKTIADAYRKKVGLLTGQEIIDLRKQKKLSQQELADLAGVGVASIKRWETGAIQTKPMDIILKHYLDSVGSFCDEVWEQISKSQKSENRLSSQEKFPLYEEKRQLKSEENEKSLTLQNIFQKKKGLEPSPKVELRTINYQTEEICEDQWQAV